MKMNSIINISILFICFLSSYSFSDTLYLKNGGTVEGIITEEGDYYVVNLGKGTANFQKNSVAEVKYSSVEEQKQIEAGWSKEKTKPKIEKPEPAKIDEEAPRHMEIGEPGQRIDITEYAVKGKLTIFDFYSTYCGPCMDVAPRLEQLVNNRNDILVRKININRPSVKGIDWDSPVVKQYNIRSVPNFKIYNERGTLWLEGKSASEKVYSWLK